MYSTRGQYLNYIRSKDTDANLKRAIFLFFLRIRPFRQPIFKSCYLHYVLENIKTRIDILPADVAVLLSKVCISKCNGKEQGTMAAGYTYILRTYVHTHTALTT